ncbi:PmoA family protein [Pseudoflavitalea rhizosphaerae]|uniref:DUF6807 domain-containing protein n=1 Tax=Pseudoflavitalea rhizosphaerae TaxID=1884793 RepID=UPI000F8E862D|nr:PmoA family protein [Pseudoflavitalea rhizosphaerae]
MRNLNKPVSGILFALGIAASASAQDAVKFEKKKNEKKIDVLIGGKFFTSFLYPDSLEKPVLFPVHTSAGTMVTRGFPMIPQPGDPTDHPHHIGIWFNYESVNGLDFWNNSYAIPPARKPKYGWIKTLPEPVVKGNQLSYRANWTNQAKDVLLEESTTLQFSGRDGIRIIERITELKARTDVVFKDVKDGMLGFRVAHALQIPELKDKEYKDEHGVVTLVKGQVDSIANGNYLTSEGKQGNDAWGTRGGWCKLYGKMGNDSVSVTIIDHPKNVNYPTWWHARGYGLFAANPLGEAVFTNGKGATNLTLKAGDRVTFRYLIVVQNGNKTLSPEELNLFATSFRM